MATSFIGSDAGTVWRALDAAGRTMSWGELLAATRLSDTRLAAAIGWLAREDKVSIANEEESVYVTLLRNLV